MQRRQPQRKWRQLLLRAITWLLALGCFYLVFGKIQSAGAREGLSGLAYLARFFGDANWPVWLALMIPYSCFFFIVDAHATWRVVRWFNVDDFKFRHMLPIRASAYILSLVNEQVGKGAITLYLWRRHAVPDLAGAVQHGFARHDGRFISCCCSRRLGRRCISTLSSKPRRNCHSAPFCRLFSRSQPSISRSIWHFLAGAILPHAKFRDAQIFRAFRRASLKHYVLVVLMKAPNLLGAVAVYTLALNLFNVDVAFGQVLAFLPVIFFAAALPLPFHAGAVAVVDRVVPGLSGDWCL